MNFHYVDTVVAEVAGMAAETVVTVLGFLGVAAVVVVMTVKVGWLQGLVCFKPQGLSSDATPCYVPGT